LPHQKSEKGLMKGIGGHHRAYRGATDEWLTPPEIIAALGSFDLDPCSPINRPWSTAAAHLTIEDDGLSSNWSGRVWMNPPYGPQTGQWLAKLADHGRGSALIFARTETSMFHRYVWERARALLFLEGRLHFYDVLGNRAKHNAGGPSVIVAYGDGDAGVLAGCGLAGYFVALGGSQ
jgi:hypothetical protein